MWRAFEHVRSSPSTSTGLGTTLESRSSTGTFPEAERPPHIDIHLERAGSLQKPEGLVGLSDEVSQDRELVIVTPRSISPVTRLRCTPSSL